MEVVWIHPKGRFFAREKNQLTLETSRRMDYSNNNNDSMQNGNNQDVLKIEVFHGKKRFFQKFCFAEKKGEFQFLFLSLKVPIDMYLFFAVQTIFVLLI